MKVIDEGCSTFLWMFKDSDKHTERLTITDVVISGLKIMSTSRKES
jgi:hypothetical protein